MCEAEVSGCQFASSVEVRAQAIPPAERPARTWAFSVTYDVSSHPTKPLWSTGSKAANVMRSSSRSADTSRRSSDRGAPERTLRSCTRAAPGGGRRDVLEDERVTIARLVRAVRGDALHAHALHWRTFGHTEPSTTRCAE